MKRVATTVATIGSGLAFLAAGVRTGGDGIELARLVILGAALGAVVVTDLAEHRIPNRIMVPAAAACAGLLVAHAVRPQQLLGVLQQPRIAPERIDQAQQGAMLHALDERAPAETGVGPRGRPGRQFNRLLQG